MNNVAFWSVPTYHKIHEYFPGSILCSATASVADPYHFNADPDPSLHFYADPDPAFHFNADPDLDHTPHQCDGNMRPLSLQTSYC